MNCLPTSKCTEREFVSVNNQISRVMSDGNVVTMDVSGLIADVLSKTKD